MRFFDRATYRKGIGLIFPNQDVGFYGNISEPGDDGGWSGKSYLFFLTVFYPGISLSGDWVLPQGKRCMSAASGAHPTSLEKPGESFICTPGRTHNRIRSDVPITLVVPIPLVVPITAPGRTQGSLF